MGAPPSVVRDDVGVSATVGMLHAGVGVVQVVEEHRAAARRHLLPPVVEPCSRVVAEITLVVDDARGSAGLAASAPTHIADLELVSATETAGVRFRSRHPHTKSYGEQRPP